MGNDGYSLVPAADFLRYQVRYFEAVRPSPPRARTGKKQKVAPLVIPPFSTFK